MHAMTKNPQLLISLFAFFILNVAIAIVAYIYSQKTETLLYEKTFQALQSVNNIKHHYLKLFFDYSASDIEALASTETVINLSKILNKLDDEFYHSAEHTSASYSEIVKADERFRDYLNSYLDTYPYDDVYIIDRVSGHFMFAAGSKEVIGLKVQEYTQGNRVFEKLWEKTLETKKSNISDMYLCPVDFERPEMLISTPIFDGSEVIAVLIIELPGQAVNDILNYREGMGRTGESYIVGEDFIIRSDSYLEPVRLSLTNSFKNPKTATVKTSAVQRALAGESATSLIEDYRGVPVLSAFRPFVTDNFTWAMMSEMDEAELLEQIGASKREIYLWALTISSIFTLLSYFIVRIIINVSVLAPLKKSFQKAKSFEEVIDNSLNEVYMFDKDTLRFTYVNRGAVLNSGYSFDEMKAMTPLDIKPYFTEEAFREMVSLLIEKEQEQIVFETVHQRKNGSYYDADIRLQLMNIEERDTFVAFINDITHRNKIEKEMEHYYQLSTHDHLTRIYNRQKFDELFYTEMKQSQRAIDTPLVLAMFDIDHFKKVNDTYGHEIGDKALCTVTNYVKEHLRDSDIFARWGGEEFMILMSHITLDEAMQKIERLRADIEKLHIDQIKTVTCSFGVTAVDRDTDPKLLFKQVDDALYQAKQRGRNRVVQYTA